MSEPDGGHGASHRRLRAQPCWDLHDFSHGRGFEIGPLDSPLVRRDEADVRYVDVYTSAHLRERYVDNPDVIFDEIQDVDFSLIEYDGTTHTLGEALAPGGPYEWGVASHVIEHIPDLVGWLAQLAEVTADDGVLVLAVPDKRYCFDAHRPLTTVGQILAAHEEGDTRPGVRAVYDGNSAAVDVDTAKLWRGERPPGYSARSHDAAYVQGMLEMTRRGDYVDSHVWLFTPDSLVEQIHELRGLGLIEWYVDRLVPTAHDELEFRARLRRIPRGTDVRGDMPDEVPLPHDLPGWVHDEHEARAALAEAELQLESLRNEVRRTRRRLRRTRRRLQRLRRLAPVAPGWCRAPAGARGAAARALARGRGTHLRRQRLGAVTAATVVGDPVVAVLPLGVAHESHHVSRLGAARPSPRGTPPRSGRTRSG